MEFGDLGSDGVFPVVALVDRGVEAFALAFVFEAADPYIDAVVGFALEAAGDDHAFGDLEGNDFALHQLEPGVHLAGADFVLAKFEEGHGRLPAFVGLRLLSSLSYPDSFAKRLFPIFNEFVELRPVIGNKKRSPAHGAT